MSLYHVESELMRSISDHSAMLTSIDEEIHGLTQWQSDGVGKLGGGEKGS